jgi:hypothetical protein
MLIIDDQNPGTAPKPSIFLHGVTGAGKSTWATAGGRPMVILTEPKAMSVLRQVNPQALGFVPESTKDLLDLFTRLGQPEWLAGKGIDRIVLDSFTDLTYTLPSWMKDGTGILLKMEIQEFGDLKSYALALVKAIQLTGYPSIIIARSTVKRVGRVEKIVPDGYGKSVEELPGKCLPTVEARYDSELGYLIDSTPDECSQRCGLPWVPPVFQGSALEFLEAVANNPATWQNRAPDLTPKETQRILGEMVQDRAAEAKTHEPSTTASAFVDGLAPLDLCTPEECVEITDAAVRNKVPMDKLAIYMHQKGYMPNPKDWTRITKEGHAKALPVLSDPSKVRGLIAHLNNPANLIAA